MKVHREHGPRILEKAYQECLFFEISQLGLRVENELSMPLTYQGFQLECGFRIDMLAGGRLVIETKAVSEIN